MNDEGEELMRQKKRKKEKKEREKNLTDMYE